MASWVTRTPAIRDTLGVSIAEMGSILFGLSVGSMSGILLAGWLVDRFGTKTIVAAGLWCIVAAMAFIAAGESTSQPLIVALGLASFGFGMGISEIAVNIDGADVERATGTHLLHALHGFFSLGTVCGALIGIALNALVFPVFWHMLGIAIFCSSLIVSLIRYIPGGSAIQHAAASDNLRIASRSLWRDPSILAIAFIVLAMALAEGSANDWLPLLIVDEYGFSQTSGSMVFLAFACAMTVGRFSGGILLKRLGRPTVIRASAIVGAIGIATIIFATEPLFAAVAVILWGLGASLGFPIAISAAGDSGPNGAERVKWVAIAGYIAFLVGPPLLGFIGEAAGLRNALLIVLTLVAAASFVRIPASRQVYQHT
jgi:fucose permease